MNYKHRNWLSTTALLAAFLLGAALPLKAQTTYTYYAIHNKDKGYLKQAKGVVANENTFRYENSHNDNGSSIWVRSSDGYLQQEMYYLNVANDATLYLSTEKVTQWTIDNTTISGKNLLKPNGSSKYLCADGGTPQLKESPSNYYNACEMTITENNSKWEGPKDVSAFTVQSPQLVTYLRIYYIRNITVTIIKNDNNETNKKVVDKRDSRCFCSLIYSSTSDENKGTKWDINETTGVIYNKQASGDVTVVATYSVGPLDPIALAAHSATNKTVTLKLQPLPFAPDAAKDYLLFYTKEANYRFPYDDGLSEDDPVKTDASKSVLTDANGQIRWKIVRDGDGFYLFQNVSTGRWLRFDESHYVTGSNYGVVEVGDDGATPTSNEYRFRLYKSGTYGSNPTYCILPFCKQWAVYKSDGVATEALTALNVYTSPTPKVISLWKVGDDSKYCILPYETEWRINDFEITGPSDVTAAGSQTFQATNTLRFAQYVKNSPANSLDLEIAGTESANRSKVRYTWEVIDIDSYADPSSQGPAATSKLTTTFTMPPVTSAGQVKLTITIDNPGEGQNKTKSKSMVVILAPPVVAPTSWTDITSLSQIISSTGNYRLTKDIGNASSDRPTVSNFSGWLDGNGHTIKGLDAPLFTNLTGKVRNLMFDNVAIAQDGSVGAVACTASVDARIYNVGILGGTVKSNDGYCGGLVGLLDGTARVINCFSYADITGGTYVGGIVGYNNYASTSSDIRTMVMNCMFYGDITDGDDIAPIYNGEIISNAGSTGMNNFNYFWLEAPYVSPTASITYNCALGAEKRFLNRFEFYRHLLNSHRELAGWWATGTYDKTPMYKWVLHPDSIGTSHPYPILKPFGKYPSVVNIDAENAKNFSSDPETRKTQRNQGRKFGTLTVNIQMGSGGAVYGPPTGAEITTEDTTLIITDKDPAHFNFNYYKVQLPYYNDVGTKNYTGNRVVTGWKIVSITGGDTGTFSTSDDWGGYNFADRNCTKKDLYSVSHRVFSQGAYWDVPEGVTAITIEPYWALAAYVSDAYPDVVYSTDMGTKYNVPNVGGGEKYKNNTNYNIAGEDQKVFTSINDAVTNASGLNKPTSNTVNDYAVVLVGNAYQYTAKDVAIGGSYIYTVTAIDLDGDNEPDYCYMLRDNGRNEIHPLKWDFLTISGTGMAQKPTGASGSYNLGILIPKGWFESTNTALFRVTQFEYEHKDKAATDALIVQGGVMEQWVSYNQRGRSNNIPYIHVGGNVWFKEFHTGCHQDKNQTSGQNRFQPTKHSPISVTGGDFDEFYLTGLYVANAGLDNYDDNAECYINGGRFGTVCGAAMEGIGKSSNTGNITWLIQNADIKEFYAGGLNAAKPVMGNLSTTITGSHVGVFCGGPKFGDMSSGKTVKTTATDCTFGTFFGAGYGGNSYNRYAPSNQNNVINIDWNKWVKEQYTQSYNGTYGGVSTQINYQFIPMSSNVDNVARLFVEFVKFSLATTHNVTSKLKHCTIDSNFYGGGSLGKVAGNDTSILDSCTVYGNVFGAGFSASLPTVEVDSIGFRDRPYYYENLGTYGAAVKGPTTPYKWKQKKEGDPWINTADSSLYTNEDLNALGTVQGHVSLTLKGNTTVGTLVGGNLKPGTGNVFGGGDESGVLQIDASHPAQVKVILEQGVTVHGDVYGGGNEGPIGGSSEVKIQNQ